MPSPFRVLANIILWRMSLSDFQQSEFQQVSSVQGALTVAAWDMLGPFQIGKTEVDASPVAAFGGLEAVHRARQDLLSELAPGGVARWTTLRGKQGHVQVEFAGVNWNEHVQVMDTMMVLEAQAFLVGELLVPPGGGGTWLLQAEHVHSFTLDGTLHHGDPYGTGKISRRR